MSENQKTWVQYFGRWYRCEVIGQSCQGDWLCVKFYGAKHQEYTRRVHRERVKTDEQRNAEIAAYRKYRVSIGLAVS